MGEWARTSANSSTFHIHVDGAVLPRSFESYAKEKYGFFNDDFDHRLVIDSGEVFPGRQLTLKLRDRAQARSICEDLTGRASEEGFAGQIQSEFVMTELLLRSEYAKYQPTPFPFLVELRKIDTKAGEEFKTHELHLELSTDAADARLINELARSGMGVSFGAQEVTFTVSGDLDQIRAIQADLLDYLGQSRGFDHAKLITEATVFHSLHRMKPENTPLVVRSITATVKAPVFFPGVAAASAPAAAVALA